MWKPEFIPTLTTAEKITHRQRVRDLSDGELHAQYTACKSRDLQDILITEMTRRQREREDAPR